MTSSIVLLYYLMSLISIRYFLLRFPAKISPPTRKNKLVIVIILNFICNYFTAEEIFTIYSDLFYFLLQQSEAGIPSSLLIPVRASGTLVTPKETGGTGSTLRTVETR